VVYQTVPVPEEPKVARRQILRNLDGNADVFYVDIDTTDLTSTTFLSALDDDTLSGREAVPLMAGGEIPYMARYAPPPSHKSVLAGHQGRIFAAADVTISAGNVIPSLKSRVVVGVGTDWRATFAGRFLYVTGATRPYEIASVDEGRQEITLVDPYADVAPPYATYAIRSAPGERKLVYYSEPALPEAWPPWNAFSVPEDNDEIVGLMVKSSFLYILERRHIYRFTHQDEPSEGMAFLSVNRGCVNGRSWVQVDNVAYLLDEAGIHSFDGDQAAEPISQPIQTIFQSDGALGGLSVDWSADRTLWHAAHDPVRDTIRWFVTMSGYGRIFHAICYDYRRRRWWIEQFPYAVTSSCTGTLGYRRSIVGSDARRVLVLSEGSLDVVGDEGPYRGTATSADHLSLTDSAASFPANLSGVPVSITEGTGRGQQAMISDNTSITLNFVDPMPVAPDPTSVYQVGGVNWSWRSGWFRFTPDESSNPRDIAVTYNPTSGPATLDVQVFYDHSDVPQDWAYGVSQDGVVIVDGDPNLTISLQSRSYRSGWSQQRFGGHSDEYAYGPKFVSVMLAGVQGSESVRVFQVDISGAIGEDR
jgi:hypothetical protein